MNNGPVPTEGGGIQIKKVVVDETPQNGENIVGEAAKPDETNLSNVPEPGNKATAESSAVGLGESPENVQAVVEIAKELKENGGLLSEELSFVTRESLAVIKEGGDKFKAYETRGEQIVVDANRPENNLTEEQKQARTAFGLDMQIDGLNMQFRELATKAQKASGKKKEEINSNLNELSIKIKKVTKEREKIKLPNQLSEFAQLFGISAEDASKFPLAQVEAYINEAINNGKFRQELLENLKSNPNLQTEEAKSTIASFENYLNAQGKRKTIEKGVKKTGEIGLGALLMSLMMMWMASKEKKQGAMG